MKRIKLGLKILILFAAILIPLKSIVMVRADSGWDSSFGGGSSFGGSSFGSSSSSSSWGSSSSSSSGGGSISSAGPGMMIFATLFISIHYFAFVQLPLAKYLAKKNKKNEKAIATGLVLGRLIPMIVLELFFPWVFIIDFFGLFLLCFIFTPLLFSKAFNTSNITDMQYYEDVKEEELKKLLPSETLESLKAKLFDVFTDVQMAWMNFDYDGLRRLCGDELATSYIQQLDALKLKHGQNKMSDFDLKDIMITSVKQKDNKVEIQVILRVSFYDYVIDVNTNKVTRGNKHNKLTNRYSLTYTKGIYEKVQCPKCGAVVETKNGNVCPYCRTKLNIVSSEYKLSKKSRA